MKAAKSKVRKIPFKMHPRVFAALGADLVTNDVVAVIELVKNAYDALANRVDVRFGIDDAEGTYIEVADDGSAFVRAMLSSLGQANTIETPNLSKWLRTLLTTIYHFRGNLSNALVLIRSPEIRHAAIEKVADEMTRSVWQSTNQLREAEFQQQLSSTVNRLIRFLAIPLVSFAKTVSAAPTFVRTTFFGVVNPPVPVCDV